MDDRDRWVNPFLTALAQTGVLRAAAAHAGVSTTAVYNRRKTDDDFAAAYEQAIEDSIDLLDHEARHRALHGVEEPVVYQGQLTPVFERDEQGDIVTSPVSGAPVQARNPDGTPKWLTVTKKSDSLLMFVLKGNRRRIYGDKTEVTGDAGGPIQIDEVKKASRIAALLALAATRKDLG